MAARYLQPGQRCCSISVGERRLFPIVVQHEWMLSAVSYGRRPLAAQAPKLSRCGPPDDEICLLCLSAFERAGALEHEGTRLTGDSPDDAFEAHERGRPVGTIHHQILNVPVSFEIAGELLCDGSSGQFREVRALAIRLLVPRLDGEPGVRSVFHLRPPNIRSDAPAVVIGA